MHTLSIADVHDWREQGRRLLAVDLSPEEVWLSDAADGPDLFGDDALSPPPAPRGGHRVPKAFLTLAERVACVRDADRWQLLYRTLWRLTHGEAHLLDLATDDDVHRLHRMAKSVKRDVHKMHAFVRFRKVTQGGADHYVAWHRPDHRIVRLAAPFFRRRFPEMLWTILTPDGSVAWDLSDLTFGPGAGASQAPAADELENLWRTYYAHIFNPARIKVKAMKAELPVRHWPTLPEAALIPDLLADAPRRVQQMIDRQRRS